MVELQKGSKISEHAKAAVQVWRDCASLRIVIQSAFQLLNSGGLMEESVTALADELKFSATTLLSSSAQRAGLSIDTHSDTWEAMARYNKAVMTYCLSEADTYHERTKNPARKGLKLLDQSISSQMEFVMADPDKRAVKRCRGASEEEYDDGPLYAALLKESVQKGASGDEYQAMKLASKFGRKSATKEVDRRASKGRKIRYTAIEKLTNFMAPRPVPLSEGIPVTDETLIAAFVNSVFQ